MDYSIPLQVKPAEFTGKGQMQALQMRDMMDNSKLKNLQIQQAEQAINKSQSINDLASNSVINNNGKSSFDQNKFVNDLYNIDPIKAQEYQSNLADITRKASEGDLDAKKQHLEIAEKELNVISKVVSSVTDNVTYQAGLQQLQQYNIDTSKLPPQYSPELIEQAKSWTMTNKDALDQSWKQLNHELATKRFNEQQQHNQATEATAKEKLNNPVEQVPTAPTEQDFERVDSLINADPELKGLENSEEFSFAVTSRARELMKQEKIGSYQATQKAINELKQNIDQGEKKKGLFGWDFLAKDTKAKFNPGKQTEQTTDTQTATNPQTGQKLILKNGQWIPFN